MMGIFFFFGKIYGEYFMWTLIDTDLLSSLMCSDFFFQKIPFNFVQTFFGQNFCLHCLGQTVREVLLTPKLAPHCKQYKIPFILGRFFVFGPLCKGWNWTVNTTHYGLGLAYWRESSLHAWLPPKSLLFVAHRLYASVGECSLHTLFPQMFYMANILVQKWVHVIRKWIGIVKAES